MRISGLRTLQQSPSAFECPQQEHSIRLNKLQGAGGAYCCVLIARPGCLAGSPVHSLKLGATINAPMEHVLALAVEYDLTKLWCASTHVQQSLFSSRASPVLQVHWVPVDFPHVIPWLAPGGSAPGACLKLWSRP